MLVKALKPTYYDTFKCSGGSCKYTCCNGWNINFNKNDYERAKNAKKSKSLEKLVNQTYKRNKKSMDDRRYGSFVLGDNMRCPLLTDEGLCSLQLECGYSALSDTCKNFPRRLSLISDNFEMSLSSGCEEVIKLLLSQKDGVVFKQDEIASKTNLSTTININNNNLNKYPLINYYYDIKTLGIAILQTQSYSLDDRMIILGIAFQAILNFQNSNNLEQIPAYVDSMLISLDEGGLTEAFSDLVARPSIAINEVALVLSDAQFGMQFYNFATKTVAGLGVSFEIIPEKEMKISQNIDVYTKAKKRLDEFLLDFPRALENILVNEFHRCSMPFSDGINDIWLSYIQFVNFYNFVKMTAIGYLGDESKLEDFILAMSTVCRVYVHNKALRDAVQEQLNKNESNTLAHMVILLKA